MVVIVILVLSDERQSSHLRHVCDMSNDGQHFRIVTGMAKTMTPSEAILSPIFFGPKVGTFTDYQRRVFVSSVIVRCSGDQVGTYR
jgi:hypothetical protein